MATPLVCKACNRQLSPYQNNSNQPAHKIDICDACKKFHWRYGKLVHKASFVDEMCSGSCEIGAKCRKCRFKRCAEVFGTDDGSLPTTHVVKKKGKGGRKRWMSSSRFFMIPCKVCGVSSTGIHFGTPTCEGCKLFFCRWLKSRRDYSCKNNNKADLSPSAESAATLICEPRSQCRRCRLDRCLAAGMSASHVVVGRYSDKMRRAINETIHDLAQHAIALPAPFYRRSQNNAPASDEASTSHSMRLSLSPSGYETQSLELCTISEMRASDNPDSLELSVAGSPQPNWSILQGRWESSEWLFAQLTEATSPLTQISMVKLIFNAEMSLQQVALQKSDAFTVYIRSIGQMFNQLPGANVVPMPDRIEMYLSAFFPVLAARLSLDFNVDKQIPNHLSLDRNGTWQMSARSNKHHFVIERFLCDAGNQMASVISSETEFAILCGLLCFSPSNSVVGNKEAVQVLRRRYELALVHYYLSSTPVLSVDDVNERIERFHSLVSLLQRGTDVFLSFVAEIPKRCACFSTVAGNLMKEFQQQICRI